MINVPLARQWLQRAMDRHARHLNGKEATTAASQKLMMTEMERALAALQSRRSTDTPMKRSH
jgi:hypothetical protein